MANPTIGATTPRIQYTATASQTVFTVPFEFLANADLAVYVNGTLKTLTTDYTLTGANTTGGGTLTFVTGRTAGEIVTILGNLAYSRNTNKYTKFGLLPAEVLEADFDALQVQSKQLARDGQFALRAPLTDTATPDMVLPVKATRASKILGFDSDGDPVASSSTVAAMDAAVTAINTIAGAAAGSSASISHIASGTGATVTTVQAKLRESISVKDFGAIGDGIVDDTVALQAAIVAAANKTLVFPNGTYRFTSALTITNVNVNFENSILLYEGAANSFALTLNSSVSATTTGYRFENLTLQCTSTDVVNRTHGICLGGGQGFLSNCRIIGFTGISLGLGSGTDSYTGVNFSGASKCYYWNIECQVSSTAGWNFVIPAANNANLITQFYTFPWNGFNESPPRTANCIDEIVVNGTGNTFSRVSLEGSPSGKVVVFGSGAQQNVFLGTTYIEFNASWNHGTEPYISTAVESSSNRLHARCSGSFNFVSDLGTNNDIRVIPGYYINGSQSQPPEGSINIIKNGDFENGTNGWSDFSVNGTLSIVSGFAKGKALRIDVVSGRPNVLQLLTVGGINSAAFVNKNVTVGYWAKTNLPLASVKLQGLRQASIPSDEQWHYIASTIKITNASASVQIITENSGLTGYVEISDVVVTLGRTPIAIAQRTDPVGSATYNPPSLTTGSQTTTTVTVAGAALGDFVMPSFSVDLQAIELSAYVNAVDTVTCVFRNDTGGTIDLASGTLRCRVIKQ